MCVMSHAKAALAIGIPHMVCRLLISDNKARWFALHAIVNLIIAARTANAVLGLHSAWKALHYDAGAVCTEAAPAELSSAQPVLLTTYLHLWHALFFRLTRDDVIHHVAFVPLLCIPGALYQWGLCGNFSLFFMCGLPGAAIYALLAAQRLECLPQVYEPRVAFLLNACMRAPGLLFIQPFLWHMLLTGRNDAPWPFVLIQVLLGPFNSLYYTRQSFQRYQSKLRGAPTPPPAPGLPVASKGV